MSYQSLQVTQVLRKQQNPVLCEIPSSIRMQVVRYGLILHDGNNDALYITGMRVLIRSATPNGLDTQPNIGLKSGQEATK